MRHNIFLLLILSIITDLALAQNLIPNSGFEEYTDCPNDYGQIGLALPWASASNGAPDYFHACSSNPAIKVPNAGKWYYSYQPARSGKGYASIRYFYNIAIAPFSEHIYVPLKEPLQLGTSYFIRFFVSVDEASLSYHEYSDCVGLAFTQNDPYRFVPDGENLKLEPAIENRGTLLTDTVGWTSISGCYTAQGTEQFAVIGNFRSEAECMLYQPDLPGVWPSGLYLYIEDVEVRPFDPLPDTALLCSNQDMQLNAGFLDATYSWSTGSTDSVIYVNQPGLYTVEATLDGCSLRDSVIVLSGEPPSYEYDTTICSGENVLLAAPVWGDYRWSTGASSRQIRVGQPGIYQMEVENDCQISEISWRVETTQCTCKVYVPDAFSPNDDGRNDFLKIYTGCNFEYRVENFQVFDRWGGLRYRAEGNEIAWDGSNANNAPLGTGIYTWVLQYSYLRDGKRKNELQKGMVHLIR